MEMWKTRSDPGHFARGAAFHSAQRARCADAIRFRATPDRLQANSEAAH